MTLPVVAYCRVSTKSQADEGVSLAAQRERIAAYCSALALPLLRVEEDVASGSIAPTKRPGLSRALASIESGEAGGLIAFKLDRLGRSTRDLLDLAERARKDGWRLISMSESLDTETAAGRLVLTILSAFAEFERSVISERTREGLAQVAREGRRRSGKIPFGYALGEDGKHLVADGAEVLLIERMLKMRQHRATPAKIAYLMACDNPRTRRPWAAGTVAAILRTHDRRAKVLEA